jgi:phage terminase large subunit GpA-like protein
MPLSQWAEKNLTLSTEYAAEQGQLRLFGWQQELFDSFTDPAVSTTVLMCGTQLTKTLFIQACLAYVAVEDPGPVLIVEPTTGDAKSFSKERLAPMLRDSAVLHGVFSEGKSRSSSNTIQEKSFKGGMLALVGAQAPGNLARRSIRYLFCDEIDKYPVNAGAEGDPIDLATKRLATYKKRRKRVLCCSPTVLGRSRIGKAYEQSDRRRPWVACPYCGFEQVLTWGQVSGVRGQGPIGYECARCKAIWDDAARQMACDRAVWRAEKPFVGAAGFWISNLYSPWYRMEELVAEYRGCYQDRERYKVFVNTTLADLWQEQGETPDEELLFARRENYPAGDKTVVPKRGLFLTAAVDVQENPPRLEYEVVAWGRDRENWSIDYGIVQAWAEAEKVNPLPVTAQELWDELGRVLQREYRHESGQMMPIMVMAIDTGKRPQPVYDFALKHAQVAYTATGLYVNAPRTVVPIKGSDDAWKVISSVSKEDAARKRQNVRIVGIGTHRVKQELYDALRHIRPKTDGSAVAGCYHFPTLYEKSYFEGLCSEKRVVKANGEVVWEKTPGVRNEPLDLKVYNRGAAAVFGIDRFERDEAVWKRFEEALKPLVSDQGPASSSNPGGTGPSKPAGPIRPVRFRQG